MDQDILLSLQKTDRSTFFHYNLFDFVKDSEWQGFDCVFYGFGHIWGLFWREFEVNISQIIFYLLFKHDILFLPRNNLSCESISLIGQLIDQKRHFFLLNKEFHEQISDVFHLFLHKPNLIKTHTKLINIDKLVLISSKRLHYIVQDDLY